MAEWKKVIVSGSAAELSSLTLDTGLANTELANDGITIAGVDTSLGGSITADTIAGQISNTTIANAQLVNDGITIGAQDTDLGGSVLNDLTHSATGSFTGSFTGDGSNLTGVSATSFDFDALPTITSLGGGDFFAASQGGTESKITFANISSSIYGGVSGDATIAAGGALTIANDSVSNAKLANMTRGTVKVGGASDAPTDLDAKTSGQILVGDGTDVNSVAVSGDATLASNGTLTLKSGIVSSSAQIDHDQTTNFDANEHFLQSAITTVGTVTVGDVSAILPAGTVSASALSSATQGTAVLTTNGVAGSTIDLGLQTSDSPTFANLTVSGDLTVQGDVTELQTTNLNVEDQFILLHSGSSDRSDSGIIFGGSGGNAQQGRALIWDSSYNSNDGRLAISTADVLSNNTTDFDFASGDGYYVAGVFEGTAVAAGNANANHNGNIRIESNEIYIYA
jgi:hypothetical protein